MTEMTDEEFRLLRDLVCRHTGIRLDDSKRSMLANRLRGQLSAMAVTRFGQYYEQVSARGDGALSGLIDSVTTQTTGFFRFKPQHEFFRDQVLPGILQRLESHPRSQAAVWSAGCSTGEEPYSLAVTVLDSLPEPFARRVRIEATDISPAAIDKATRGTYPAAKTRSLTARHRLRYFQRNPDGNLSPLPEVRGLVQFRVESLGESHRVPDGHFDVIFCRYVLIYFGDEYRRARVRDFARALRSGGFLMLGPSEMILDPTIPLQLVSHSTYRKL